MAQENSNIFWFDCPSGKKYHQFENPQSFLDHIQTCSYLYPSKQDRDIAKTIEYAVCPQNSLHLKRMLDPQTGNRWSLNSVQEKFFKHCRHPPSMALQNKQDTIKLGVGHLNGYLTLVNSLLEENQREETTQENIILQDFEDKRRQFLNEQQFSKTMGSSRNIQFSKSNNQIVNMALVKTSKDLKWNFRNFANSCQIIDEDEEGFQLNNLGDRMEFLKRLMEDKPGMYLTVTQKNSISIQKEFERPREYYFVRVGEKEIGLLMKQQFETSKTFKLVFLSQEEYSQKGAKQLNDSYQCYQGPELCYVSQNPPPIPIQMSDQYKTKNLGAANIIQKDNQKPSIQYSNSAYPSNQSSRVTITIDNEVEIIDLGSPKSFLPTNENFQDKKQESPLSILSTDESEINNKENEWLENDQDHQPKIIQLDDDKHNFIIFRKMKNLIQNNNNKIHSLDNNILHRNISKLKNQKIKSFTLNSSSHTNNTGKSIQKKNSLLSKYNETIQELRKQQTQNDNTQSFANRLSKLVSNKQSEQTS